MTVLRVILQQLNHRQACSRRRRANTKNPAGRPGDREYFLRVSLKWV